MLKTLQRLLIIAVTITLASRAYSQGGKVGINTTTPAAMLHVKDSSVVFTGATFIPGVPGSPPVSGAGTRMMWYPDKASFRVGTVYGAEWNKENIGEYSFATGFGNKASGNYSSAMGFLSEATGNYSFSAGHSTNAIGAYSTALGLLSEASGQNSMAVGAFSKASGFSSIALGHETYAKSFASLVIGRFNDTTSTSSSSWVPTDPVFVIGNGTNNTMRSNALTVLKDGKIGIGISNPAHPLSFPSTVGDKISLYGSGNAHYGFGINNSLMLIHTGGFLDDIAFGYGSSTAFTETMRITGFGYLGIGTYPYSRFHVRSGISGGFPNLNTIAFFESNSDAYLNIQTPVSNESGILFGNPTHPAHGGIVYNSPTTSSGLQFRTAQNTVRMVIDYNGKVGIGTSSPPAQLSVIGGDSGASPHPYTLGLFESGQETYLTILTPSSKESGILAGNEFTPIKGGILFRTDSAVHIRSGGNVSNIIVDKNGRIGIGNVTPGFPLNFPPVLGNKISLHGSSGNHYGLGVQDYLLQIYTAGINADVAFGYGSSTSFTETMRIKGTGNIGIGTSAPTERLHVVGDICYTGSISACSDIRYKENFLPIINALTSLQSIDGMYYHWKAEDFPEKEFNTERQIGFSAQEIEKIYPEVVQTDPDGYKSVDYSRLTPVLVEAIKEQQEIINRQQEQIDSLLKRFSDMEQQLDTMKQ